VFEVSSLKTQHFKRSAMQTFFEVAIMLSHLTSGKYPDDVQFPWSIGSWLCFISYGVVLT